MTKISVLILIFFCDPNCGQGKQSCGDGAIEQFLYNVIQGSTSSYSSAIAPDFPVIVNSTFIVHDIVEVNEVNGYAVVTLHFIGTWIDSRLALPCYPQTGAVVLSTELQGRIWRPPLTITGATQGLTQSAPLPIRSVEIFYDGRIKFMESFTSRFPCQGNYKVFPFDVLVCNLFIGGTQPMDEIIQNWITGKPLVYAPWAKTGSFNLKALVYQEILPDISDPTNVSYTEPTEFYQLGNSPVYTVVMGLKRQYEYYILAMYLPIIVIVVIAWLSMWFPFDSTRVSICLTCLLSIMLQYISISSQLPKVGYIKGVDVLMLGCLLFLAVILLEYTVLMSLMKDKDKDQLAPGWAQCCGFKESESGKLTLKEMVAKVDALLKWLILFIFIAFITGYFLFSRRLILFNLTRPIIEFAAGTNLTSKN